MMKGPCKVDGCERTSLNKGMCRMHYLRNYKHGDPNIVKKQKRGLIDIVEVNGCFECTSLSKSKFGYPMIHRNSKYYAASRFVYEQCFGPIEKGLVVRHKCDNPSCVNPEHLELGTIQDNNNDREIRGRTAKGEQNGQSKLTADEVREIRTLLDNGERPTDISRKFNISPQNVFDIRARRSWKHVE